MSYTEQLNQLSKDLLEDIKNVRNGSLSLKKAREISALSAGAIKAIAIPMIHEENIKLQDRKLLMRAKELDFQREELEYKKSKV